MTGTFKRASNNKNTPTVPCINCATCCSDSTRLPPPFPNPPSLFLHLCCMTSAGLRLKRIETTGIVAKTRVRIWSYLYRHQPRETSGWSFPPSGGGLVGVGRAEKETNINKNKVKETGSGPADEAQAPISWVSLWILGLLALCRPCQNHLQVHGFKKTAKAIVRKRGGRGGGVL